MKRRNMLSYLGSLAALPILGRTAFSQSMQMTPDHQQPGPEAVQHMQQTAAVGSLSLLVSREALNKVHAPKLLQFAKLEVAEQNTISDIIKGMNLPASQAQGTVVPPSDDEAKSHLDPDGRNNYAKLQGLSGDTFEKAYLQVEIDGHQKLLAIQNSYLSKGHNREELDLAKLAKGMIQEHLELLHDLKLTDLHTL